MEARPHILNFDNYCNVISNYLKSSEKGAYTLCLWTGATLKRLPEDSDLGLVVGEDGNIVPAMPEDLHAEVLREELLGDLKLVDEDGDDRRERSLGHKYNIRSFPPKPKVTDEMKATDPALARAWSGPSKDGLYGVYPHSMMNENPASNIGLANILQKVFKERGVENESGKKYVLVMTDVNIYHRINKVQFI